MLRSMEALFTLPGQVSGPAPPEHLAGSSALGGVAEFLDFRLLGITSLDPKFSIPEEVFGNFLF